MVQLSHYTHSLAHVPTLVHSHTQSVECRNRVIDTLTHVRADIHLCGTRSHTHTNTQTHAHTHRLTHTHTNPNTLLMQTAGRQSHRQQHKTRCTAQTRSAYVTPLSLWPSILHSLTPLPTLFCSFPLYPLPSPTRPLASPHLRTNSRSPHPHGYVISLTYPF